MHAGSFSAIASSSRALVAIVTVVAGAHALAQSASQEHPGQFSQADIVSGSRLYSEQCTTCHGATGNAVGNVDLRRGRFRNASSDEDLKRLIANGIPNTAMPPFKFSDAELNAVVAYVRSGLDVTGRAPMVGNADRGRSLFTGKGQCSSCHGVGGAGAAGAAPDLSDVATIRTAQSLHQSLLDPSSVMMPINRPVRLVTRSGQTIRGRRLNEDTYSIQLINEQGRLQSVAKADLREYEIMQVSPMPSYRGKLTSEEIADLVAYLQSLRG
jgi:putative heme-binding domain-containing protein